MCRVHRVWSICDASGGKTRKEEEQEAFQEGQSQGGKHIRMIIYYINIVHFHIILCRWESLITFYKVCLHSLEYRALLTVNPLMEHSFCTSVCLLYLLRLHFHILLPSVLPPTPSSTLHPSSCTTRSRWITRRVRVRCRWAHRICCGHRRRAGR